MMKGDFSDKYIIFIASGGRTGTTFFGELLSGVIKNSFSVHEPDLFAGFNVRTWQAIKTFGFYHMMLGRFLGQTGLRNLTQKYLAGTLSDDDLVKAIRQHREKYYNGISEEYIIESYSSWYGILPGIPKVFPNYKVVGVIRDPRTWVQSWINYEGLYDKKDRVLKYGAKRINPIMIGDEHYADKWETMSAFEKICWQWLIISKTLKKYESQDCNIKVLRYEDIFMASDRAIHMENMLRFITNFGEKYFSYDFDPALLETVKNASNSKNLKSWQVWSSSMCRQLDAICGPFMNDLGYGMEKEWRDRISQNV